MKFDKLNKIEAKTASRISKIISFFKDNDFINLTEEEIITFEFYTLVFL
ncbi:hypothetical protein [Spiroplasma endosymbiont of Amphibalanus improvisus]